MGDTHSNPQKAPDEQPKPKDPIPVDPRLSSTVRKGGQHQIDPIPVDTRLSGSLKEAHEKEHRIEEKKD